MVVNPPTPENCIASLLSAYPHQGFKKKDFTSKNTSWGCRSTTQRGRTLGQLVRSNRKLKVYAPEDATIPEKGRWNVLYIFLAYRTTVPWDVRMQFALNSYHFLVTARIGGDPLKARTVSRVAWGRFGKGTGLIERSYGQLEKGWLSEAASEFTKEVQSAGGVYSPDTPETEKPSRINK